MKNALNWFEIPVENIERAKKFYETIMGKEMHGMEAMGMKSAFFPADLENGIGGCIVEGKGYTPSLEGSIVYLNGGLNLSTILQKVDAAGGKVLMPKTGIGQNGFLALFQDIEVNKIGLHSPT